jgi:hypothetical protein
MSKNNIQIKNIIKKYLSEEKILKGRVSDSKLDFGYVFSFPPGPQNQQMSVFKLKSRDFIQIAIRVQLADNHKNRLQSLENNKEREFFNSIRRYFISKEVYFKIDMRNYGYEVFEQIFPNNQGYISKNTFFKACQKVFYCFLFTNSLLVDYSSGTEIPSSNFDFSLYS